MQVYLSTTNPGPDAEALESDPVYLIRGPVDAATGRTIYYLTRAVQAYKDPGGQQDTIDAYFDLQSAGAATIAVKLDDGIQRLMPLAHAPDN
jgi:hypothetical protein